MKEIKLKKRNWKKNIAVMVHHELMMHLYFSNQLREFSSIFFFLSSEASLDLGELAIGYCLLSSLNLTKGHENHFANENIWNDKSTIICTYLSKNYSILFTWMQADSASIFYTKIIDNIYAVTKMSVVILKRNQAKRRIAKCLEILGNCGQNIKWCLLQLECVLSARKTGRLQKRDTWDER